MSVQTLLTQNGEVFLLARNSTELQANNTLPSDMLACRSVLSACAQMGYQRAIQVAIRGKLHIDRKIAHYENSLKTKMLLYNSNVKSVLVYGSETWRLIQSDVRNIEVFHKRCLRRICQIFWPNKISNKKQGARASQRTLHTDA